MRAEISNEQIRGLRRQAYVAGDLLQAELCDVALSGEDSDGFGTALGLPVTCAAARAACARLIGGAK